MVTAKFIGTPVSNAAKMTDTTAGKATIAVAVGVLFGGLAGAIGVFWEFRKRGKSVHELETRLAALEAGLQEVRSRPATSGELGPATDSVDTGTPAIVHA